jgi:phosphocarrier protein
VQVRWEHGLHLLPASKLARLARRFRSSIRVICGKQSADAASIISLLILSATMGTELMIETQGDDERDAASAVEALFSEDSEEA